MFKKLFSFVGFCGALLFIGSFCCFTSVSADEKPDWDDWDDSVIRLLVIGENGLDSSVESGTAFAINDNGDYVTNHHVVATAINNGDQSVVAAVESLDPKVIHKVKIVWESEEHDLAVVNVDTWKNKPLTLSNGDLLKKGQDVYSVGFPGAADRNNVAEFNVSTLKKGVFSAFKNFSLTGSGRKIKMLEHDAPVNSGNSGGPLADACGRVVGINEQKSLGSLIKQGKSIAVNATEGILFSINSVELMALLDKHNNKYSRNDNLCVIGNSPGGISNKMLVLVAGLGLMTILAFIFLYRRTQQASPDGHFNTRVLSKMIRDRISDGQGSSHKKKTPAQPRSYYSQDEGRIIHRNEQSDSKRPLSPPNPVPQPQNQALYRLVPQRGDIGLPTLVLSGQGNYRLGRDQGSNIQLVIPNQYVSSEHAVIIVNPDQGVVVEALKSTNGTQIAGEALSVGEFRTLFVGQAVRFGHDEVVYTLQRG